MDSSQPLSWFQFLVQDFGYLGIFFINLIGCATIFLPLPAVVSVFIFGAILDPWLVGFSAALGATLGEVVGYGLGRGGGMILEKRNKKFLEKGGKWFKKGGIFPFISIILFAATPLPDDVVGILSGAFNYNIKKFLLASFIGKSIMALALAWGGFYGINWILSIFKLGL